MVHKKTPFLIENIKNLKLMIQTKKLNINNTKTFFFDLMIAAKLEA